MASASARSPPGVLWVTSSLKNTDLPVSLLDTWYEEHMDQVLTCRGNSGLFLRYKNLDAKAHPYNDPKFNARSDPSETTWPFLALVKLNDVSWLAGESFTGLPMTSKLLPPEADGTDGNAFNNWFGAARSYETVHTIPDPTGRRTRPRYVLTVQLKQEATDIWETMDKAYMKQVGFRGLVRYKLVKGLLLFQEEGDLPPVLIVYEFDGDKPPRLELEGLDFRTDVWTLTHERRGLTPRL